MDGWMEGRGAVPLRVTFDVDVISGHHLPDILALHANDETVQIDGHVDFGGDGHQRQQGGLGSFAFVRAT